MGYGIGKVLKRYMEYYNISGVDFAESLGITPKHLSEIVNKNIDISDELILAISLVTDIEVEYILKLENNKKTVRYLNNRFKNEDDLNEYLNSFYLKEMVKRSWICLTHKENVYNNAIDMLKFFKVRNFEILDEKVNNTLFKKKEDSDSKKIITWISRCDNLAREEKVSNYTKSSIDEILLYLRKERLNDLNINGMIDYFNSKGLYLVIEPALKGTKIRGCSKVKRDKPAIYLTTLYKDKASFYFALYHEIGHIKKHYNKAKNKYIIDGEDKLEREADDFALNEMIPDDLWELIIKGNEMDYINISKDNDIPMCFIVSRLAKEKYISYSSYLYNEYIEKLKI